MDIILLTTALLRRALISLRQQRESVPLQSSGLQGVCFLWLSWLWFLPTSALAALCSLHISQIYYILSMHCPFRFSSLFFSSWSTSYESEQAGFRSSLLKRMNHRLPAMEWLTIVLLLHFPQRSPKQPISIPFSWILATSQWLEQPSHSKPFDSNLFPQERTL